MVVERGEIWWANLPEPKGSSPGFRRPILIIQADIFNQTNIKTVIAATITTNADLAKMLGNVSISSRSSGLPQNSVINVTQLFTVDKSLLLEYVGTLSARKMQQVDKGLRLVLSL
jgi:mRNA interferase MazF